MSIDLFNWAQENNQNTVPSKPISDTKNIQNIRNKLALKKFITRMTDKTKGNPEIYRSLGEKIITYITNKDVQNLRHWMNGINPNINKMFSEITKLPAKTQKEADSSIRSLNPTDWDNWKKSIDNTKTQEKQKKIDAVILKKVNHNGEITTYADAIKKILKTGFKPTIKTKNNRNHYFLCSPTHVIRLPNKIIYDFANEQNTLLNHLSSKEA